jgi:hypothetical protein
MKRVTYSGTSGAYRGVIRDGKEVIWECPHFHRNRDVGHSAQNCARMYLNSPEYWQEQEDRRVAEMEARRARGWH